MKQSGKEDPHRYDDMLKLPHPVSRRHPQMSMHDRAAQFAPFSALTAHGAAIRETARWTDQKIELEEDKRQALDQKLHMVCEEMQKGEYMQIKLTYFVKDERKSGGSYITKAGEIRRINSYDRTIRFEDGTQIRLEDVIELEISCM